MYNILWEKKHWSKVILSLIIGPWDQNNNNKKPKLDTFSLALLQFSIRLYKMKPSDTENIKTA